MLQEVVCSCANLCGSERSVCLALANVIAFLLPPRGEQIHAVLRLAADPIHLAVADLLVRVQEVSAQLLKDVLAELVERRQVARTNPGRNFRRALAAG